MADGLNIRIGADVSPAIDGLRQVEKRMRETVAAGQSFGKGIDRAAQSLKQLPNTTNQATNSLMNLSRVAQDAPYGFIGIANNINPLLESFQRLKASTGTTGGAFKALGASLTGPAGLGLAVGVVSSLMIVFGDKLFGSSKKAKEAKEELEKFNKVMAETQRTASSLDITAGGSTSGESAKVSALAAVVQDQTRSYKERNQALLELKEINKSYFGDLSIEAGKLNLLTSRVNEYSQAIINAAIQKTLGEDIAKVSVEKASQLNKYNGLLKDQSKYLQEVRKWESQKQVDRYGNESLIYGAQYLSAKKALESYNKELSALGSTISGADVRVFELQQLLNNAVNESFRFRPLKVDNISVKPSKLSIEKPTSISDIKIDDTFSIPLPEAQIKNGGYSFADMYRDELDKINKGISAYDPSLFAADKAWKQKQEQLAKMANVVTNTLQPAFESFFNTIAEGGGNAFRAFAQAAKAALTQLIGKLVTTIALAGILSAMGLIPKGAAGGSFKDIFNFLLGFGGKRAGGGAVGGGLSYLVGENGPEIFTPSTAGSVIPNHQLGRGNSGGGTMRAIVRGQNILLAVARTGRSNNRLGLNGI